MSELLHIPINQELSARVRWLISLRWLVLTLAALLVLLANARLGNVLPAGALWGTVIAIAAYNSLFWIVARHFASMGATYRGHTVMLHLQIISDLVALTALLHFSGGLENPFSTYYVLLVAIGGLLMTGRASYAYAAIATGLWILLLVGEATGVFAHYNLVGFRLPTRYREVGHIVASVVVLATANAGVSVLACSVASRLREGEIRLWEADSSCEIRARELARVNERLNELDRNRSWFIRLVTHELRAPVAAIQSYLNLILEGYVPNERLLEIVGKAEQRARDQLDLIADLLDLAHLQDSPHETRPEPCDLCAALEDILDMMQARITDKSLRLTVHIVRPVPRVRITLEHARQIWTNLMSNAIKYTPEGGAITVTLTAEGGFLKGSVADTGIGIAPEEQPRVFEAFYRTEAAKAMARHGTGLGLSIFRGIVERYGGRVTLVSHEGRGSTFAFTLPVAEEAVTSTSSP